MSVIDKVLDCARNEIGYLEKASNKDLDDKTKNAGSNNYTKYGRDLKRWLPETGDTYGVNYQWCDQFVDWIFYTLFGKENAKKLLGGWSAYTPTSADFFQKMGRWHKGADCKAGDIIFFRNSERICHTGIIEKFDGKTITTIEGNTSGANGVISNGGGVKRKTYTVGDSYISGYGRPNYAIVEDGDQKPGWYKDKIGWWYRHTEGHGKDTYYHDCIAVIGNEAFLFNSDGYMIENPCIIEVRPNARGAINNG